MTKKCELCRLPARLYCESDEANLCTACDLKVHEANFLVARHSRRLLCKRCQCLTPWKACGARLGNMVTECDKCAEGEIIVSGLRDEEAFNNEVFCDESSDDNELVEEGEGENQLQETLTSVSSSFSSSDCGSISTLTPLKRMRKCDDVTDHNKRRLQI